MELCLVVDHDCNLRCRYCYTGRKRRQPMSEDVTRRAVALALARDSEWLSVSLFGGEPLLDPGRLQAIERITQEELAARHLELSPRWLLDTNGTLLDDAALAWLAPPRPARVFVSLDGPAWVHDRLRVDAHGQGTHARALTGVHRLRARGIACELVAVIDPHNVAELGESLSFLLELGAERVTLQPNLRGEWPDAAIDAIERGVDAAARVWAEAFRRGASPIVEPFHRKVLSHLLGGAPCPARCQIATSELAVAPSGRLYPCAEMVGEDVAGGDLVIGSVFEGVDEARVLALRQRARVREPACDACDHRRRCQHDCACRQLASGGGLGRIGGVLCELEAAFINATDRASEALYAEGCRAFVDLYYGRSWAIAPGARPRPPEAAPVQLRRRHAR